MGIASQSIFPQPFRAVGCAECRNAEALGFDFTMAFQLIVDIEERRPFAYEALVRGCNGESAGGEFVGRAWVEGHTNFVGDDVGKDVDVCGVNQGVARSGNGVEGGAKSGSSESSDRQGRHCGKQSSNDGGKGLGSNGV